MNLTSTRPVIGNEPDDGSANFAWGQHVRHWNNFWRTWAARNCILPWVRDSDYWENFDADFDDELIGIFFAAWSAEGRRRERAEEDAGKAGESSV